MRAFIIVALALTCTPASAGELFDPQGQAYWANVEASRTGQDVEFQEILDIGGILYNGATIGYVDLLGTASSLTLYKSSTVKGGLPSPFGNWIYPVATVAAPLAVEGGWTRFDFRSLKLLVTNDIQKNPPFEGGYGPLFGVTDGSFSAVVGQDQAPKETGSAFYAEMPAGSFPTGPIPTFRVIWETLDAPYVAENGDANQDGRVDLTDFGILKASFGQNVAFRQVADFDGNSVVNFDDFDRLKANFGWKAPAAVPEPNALLLAFAGVAALVLCCFYR